MRMIPKKILKEDNNTSTTKNTSEQESQYIQAILAALASETRAFSEYDKILNLGKKLLDTDLHKKFEDTLIDIRDEETKHIAQLNAKLQEIPMLKDAYTTGTKEAETGIDTSSNKVEDKDKKESTLKESLSDKPDHANKTFDNEDVLSAISDVLQLNNEQYSVAENIIYKYTDSLSAEEVDEILLKTVRMFPFTSADDIPRIEDRILELTQIKRYTAQEEENDKWADDIYYIQEILDEHDERLQMYTKYLLRQVITKLEENIVKTEQKPAIYA